MDNKKPVHCGGCSNDCLLSSPSCVIGMLKSEDLKKKEETNDTQTKDRK